MKRYPQFIVLLVLIGLMAFITADAIAGGCRLTGTWRGCKGTAPDCEDNGFRPVDLVVTIIAQDLYKINLSIFTQHDIPQIPSFQGDAVRVTMDSWNYTVYATDRPDTCWVSNGHFHFNRQACEITFEETVESGSFHGPDAEPPDVSCTGDTSTGFTGMLLKSGIGN